MSDKKKENSREIYYSMRHDLKKSRYFLSLFNKLDLIIWSMLVLVIYISILLLVSRTLPSLINGILLIIMIIFAILVFICTTIHIDIFHNGLGYLICLFKFHTKEKEDIVWGGINYGFESLSDEKTTKEAKKYKRRESA